jgi:biofilm PGA synthesis N-glycosyltransferase PgaC
VSELSYAAITPARDEVANLPRLARSLAAQTLRPHAWVIVDNGSRDGTLELAHDLAATHAWIRLLEIEGDARPARGAPIVRALHAGIDLLAPAGMPDVVVALDADISFRPDYFERLLEAFAADSSLGIASGSGWEEQGGRWCQRHVTGSTVWGASRAYRRECLQAVLPLEPRLGWDGIDEFKANARGWRTRTVTDLPFFHHRPEGQRDGHWRMRVEQGRLCHYVGYRPWYLILRALFNATRNPAALGLVHGYLAAALAGAPRLQDKAARAYVRRQQRPVAVLQRAREALGRGDASGGGPRGSLALDVSPQQQRSEAHQDPEHEGHLDEGESVVEEHADRERGHGRRDADEQPASLARVFLRRTS